MDLTRALLAYDEVMGDAMRAGRAPNTADKIHALRAAIQAYEADKAVTKAMEDATKGDVNG